MLLKVAGVDLFLNLRDLGHRLLLELLPLVELLEVLPLFGTQLLRTLETEIELGVRRDDCVVAVELAQLSPGYYRAGVAQFAMLVEEHARERLLRALALALVEEVDASPDLRRQLLAPLNELDNPRLMHIGRIVSSRNFRRPINID